MPNDGKQTRQSQSNAGGDQRQKLEQSEREAARKGGAENYQDAERDEKVVSTGQDNPNDVGSIRNIDNDKARKDDQSKG